MLLLKIDLQLKFYFMRKRLLKIILLTSIVSIGISSCKKEFNDRNGSNAPESNTRGSNGPKTNRPPVANAGADQVITLPSNSVNLNGGASTDPDNNITSYQWTKFSGPSSFTIVNPNSVQTQVTNLVAGVYQFELKVTDQFGLYDKDMVQVTVVNSSEPSPPPCTTCKIVFVSARDGNNEIYTSNTDGSNITRLTNDPGYDSQPAWSPDGTRIAFTSDRGGSSEIYIMNADGSNVVQRTFSGGCQDPTWSPDGTKIAFSDFNFTYPYGSSAIFTVSATSGSPVFLSVVGDSNQEPAWSPDGTKIALASDMLRQDLSFDIYTINANDGAVNGGLTYGSNYGIDHIFGSPSWSPNDAKLAVVYSGGLNSYIPHVGVMNSDGSGFTLLRSGRGGTSWSGDGTVIVYTSQSESGSMWNVSWVASNGSASGIIITNGWDADWKH
jgi:Tol biopolymer transport system component